MKRQDLKTGTEFRYTSDIEEFNIPRVYTVKSEDEDTDDISARITVALSDRDVVPLDGPTGLDVDIALAFALGVGVLVGGCTAEEAIEATDPFPGEDKMDAMWGMVAGITGFPAFPVIDPVGFALAFAAGERIAEAVDCSIVPPADSAPRVELVYDEYEDDSDED